MNRDQSFYVSGFGSQVLIGHCSWRAMQGGDADDFNPDRFIDDVGQLVPAIADTKDGS
jgi:hypothetical protein